MMIVYFCIAKGVKISGKIAVYTGILPFFLLLVLIIRGLFLPGALDGFFYAFKPDLKKILYPSIWCAAVE